MIEENAKKDFIAAFIAISYALSMLLSIFIGLSGGHESQFIRLGYTSMLIPAIAVLVMITVFKAPLKIDWSRFPLRWLPLALFLMPVVIHAVCLPLFAFLNNGSLPWQVWLKPDEGGLYDSPANKGWGALTTAGLVVRILMNAGIGVIVVSVLAFFEEIGWRGWLLPRLIKRFNAKKAVLAGAAIWALWHIPFVLSGISYIDNVPVYATLLVPIGTFGAGIIISWFWLKTKSIWIVSVAHGALNNWGQYSFKYMQDSTKSSDSIWLLVGVDASLLILALIIFVTMKNDYSIDEIK